MNIDSPMVKVHRGIPVRSAMDPQPLSQEEALVVPVTTSHARTQDARESTHTQATRTALNTFQYSFGALS